MSGQQNWQTPPALFALLADEFEFTFDLAADPTNHLTPRFANGPCVAPAACECGLCVSFPLGAERIFCNPEYQNVDPWIAQFARLGGQGHTVAALLQPKTDARWFGEAARTASEIRFMRGRVQFVDPTDSRGGRNQWGSILAVWRPFHRPTGAHLWVWDWRAGLEGDR